MAEVLSHDQAPDAPTFGEISGLTIAGEADEANAKATRDCAKRWFAAGVDVSLLEPAGGDANDVLREMAS